MFRGIFTCIVKCFYFSEMCFFFLAYFSLLEEEILTFNFIEIFLIFSVLFVSMETQLKQGESASAFVIFFNIFFSAF